MSAPVSLSGIKRTYNPSIEGEKRQKVEKSLALVTINAGGQRFQFYRSTLEDHTFSVISAAIRYEDKEEYFVDVNGKIFESYIDPYLRDGLIPSVDDFATNIHFNQALIAARKLCLTPLVNSLTLPKGSIGVAEWKKYFGVEVMDEPQFSGEPLKKDETLVLIPKDIDVLQAIKKNNSQRKIFLDDKVKSILDHMPKVFASYWLVFSMPPLIWRNQKTFRKDILARLTPQGNSLPNIREAIILCLMGGRLFPSALFNFPLGETSMICSETEQNTIQIRHIGSEGYHEETCPFAPQYVTMSCDKSRDIHFILREDSDWFQLQDYAVRRV